MREFQPFFEMNWLHNTETETADVRMNGEGDSVKGLRNVAEMKTGMEGRL
ncbi:autotransporter outer membrane beta-barrel domain-containing protein [Pantoea allii]|nr:autotransporter outer membrane beta-barrel domain-containing protein [Pantoea allii]